MKYRLYLLIICFLTVLTSCLKDTDTIWFSYGTYYETNEINEGFVVRLDNGSTLIPSTVWYVEPEVKDSTRVHVSYAIKNEFENEIIGKDLSVASILTKEIIQLDSLNEDSIGNDPVIINEMWFSENHVNIIFSFYRYANIQHYINLVKPINSAFTEDNRLILEFRHNANNDNQDYLQQAMVSFNMLNVLEPDIDSLPLVINYIDYARDTNSINATYYRKQ